MASSSLQPDLTEIIARSHARSAGYGIDPGLPAAPESSRLSAEALQQRIADQRLFYDTACARLEPLYGLLKHSGFAIALADSAGYILYVLGDADLLEGFRQRHCMPGYRWTERDLGTCAIGLVLEEQIPLFLPGEQMFTIRTRVVSNAAAPVFAAEKGGTLLGVVCLSGYSDKMHPHTMALVQQAVEGIGANLREQAHLRRQSIQNRYLAALLEANSHGMLAVNRKGEIVQCNSRARKLLQLPKKVLNRHFNECIDARFDIETPLKSGSGFRRREIRAGQGGTAHYAFMDPVRLASGELVGGLITVMEKRETIHMAAEMTGSSAHFVFSSIVGRSEVVQEAVHLAEIAARNASPVLISGETGTGKELFAQAIHNGSLRQSQPFVAINCGAIPRELLESELFGYEEGAFTGARKGGRPGKLELADHGTLFLDEIGDMPLDMQVKLLRVLQSGEVQRVGGLRTLPIDIRIIAATNIDIKGAIEAKAFRADLYYRISTFKIPVPPLRRRGEDILLLAEHFLRRLESQQERALRLDASAEALLLNYRWPGNIRQLENVMERAANFSEGGVLQPEHFGLGNVPVQGTARVEVIQPLAQQEKEAVIAALDHFGGNIRQAAKALGISRPTIYRKLKLYGLTVREEYVPLRERG